VSIGQDTSGYFKLSFNGLAVKAPDGRFLAYVRDSKDKTKDHLLDVSELTLDGTDNFIYRIPVPFKKVKRGDLVITSEDPFSAVFARDDADANGQFSALNPEDNTKTEYIQPANLFNIQFFVKVFSPIAVGGLAAGALGGGAFEEKLLPLLLLGDKKDDGLAKLLLLQGLSGGALGGKALEGNNLLPLLLLSDKGGKSNLLEILLLLQALEGEEGHEGATKGGSTV